MLLTSCIISRKYQQSDLNMPEKYRSMKDNIVHAQDTLLHQPHYFFKNTSLLLLLDSAFLKNSDLLLAVQNIALAEKTLNMVKLNYLPELNAQINGSYTKASENSLAGQSAGRRETKDFNFSTVLSWDIDIWGKIKNEKKEALANYLKTQEVCKAVQTRLVSDIAKGYYNLLMLDEQLNIANKSRELSDSTLRMMRIQYQVGDANILGVRQVEAQLEGNKMLISQIEQSISLQESALSVLCGSYASSISRQREDKEEFHSVPAEGYPAYFLSTRPDIKAAELSLQAANARIGVSQAAMYPNINISLSGGLNSLTSSNWFSVPASLFGTVAGGITQPIFNRKKLRTQYEQALIEREKEVIRFRQAVLEGYAQVSDALKNKEETEKQFIFALNKEMVLKDNISAIRVLFTVGAANYLDIITVQSAYLEARLQTARLSMEKVVANVELYAALGGGW
ncbi:MAG: TolC family protein [Massilibacteroides sp.]|nr:TolC family protein [Massilibacteroides sp.]MDD3061345.1 TolC family protein [Massilibacteroides sp.]MDD4114641.1 TolC family protein [Massilibacteroides sp.]MDD4659436.1 TolC family protein [Massilibacteroides sp.]